jgi:hypothetical protein
VLEAGRGKLVTRGAVMRTAVRTGRLSESIGLFEQQPRLLDCRLGFRRGIAFHVDEGGYQRDLELDFFATERRRCRNGRYLTKCARELLYCFNQRRALQRSPCQSPAMPNGRCRMHGGSSPGAPVGNKNALKHGLYTAEAIARRRSLAELIRAARQLVA